MIVSKVEETSREVGAKTQRVFQPKTLAQAYAGEK